MVHPVYVYKLVPSTAPPQQPIPKELPLSDLDATSGFIHLSTALQVPGTLKHFFADEPRVYVLRIEYARISKDVKWEDPKAKVCGTREDEGMFPHLYNSRLGRDEVESMEVWENDGVGWDETLLKAASWLL